MLISHAQRQWQREWRINRFHQLGFSLLEGSRAQIHFGTPQAGSRPHSQSERPQGSRTSIRRKSKWLQNVLGWLGRRDLQVASLEVAPCGIVSAWSKPDFGCQEFYQGRNLDDQTLCGIP